MEGSGKGYILVNVRTAGGALPVEGASVTVSGTDGILAVMLTDSSGRSQTLELPTPPRENSLDPSSNAEVSSQYTVDTVKDGFYEVIVRDIPVFDGITSIQQILLVPVARADGPLQPYDLTRFDTPTLPEL